MEFETFKAEHLAAIDVQDSQAHLGTCLTPKHAKDLESAGTFFTGIHDGRPIIVFGIMDVWRGRAIAWALVDKHAGPHFLAITRAVRRFLDHLHSAGRVRIEADVDAEFKPGHRWAKLLGFELEVHMLKYGPDGSGMSKYVRIR